VCVANRSSPRGQGPPMHAPSKANREPPHGSSNTTCKCVSNLRTALKILVDEGYVVPSKDGKAVTHQSQKPYRAADDEGARR
jgi:hypothetical protein